MFLYFHCVLTRTQSVSFLYAFFLVDLDFVGDKSLRLLVIINDLCITLKAHAPRKGGYEVTEKLIRRGRTAVGVVVFSALFLQSLFETRESPVHFYSYPPFPYRSIDVRYVSTRKSNYRSNLSVQLRCIASGQSVIVIQRYAKYPPNP